MKIVKYWAAFILIINLLYACKGQNTEPAATHEFENLQSTEDHKVFLEDIFEKDQYYRRKSGEIIQTYGYESPEHLQNSTNLDKLDSINLSIIEQYLVKFGYPNKELVGEIAAYAPWAVIHHSGLYDERVRNYNYIKTAFDNGNIDQGSFMMYLDRTYLSKTGNSYDRENSGSEEERIRLIIEELGLKQ